MLNFKFDRTHLVLVSGAGTAKIIASKWGHQSLYGQVEFLYFRLLCKDKLKAKQILRCARFSLKYLDR